MCGNGDFLIILNFYLNQLHIWKNIMPLRIAYLGVILIWSTTPLAIQWSSESAGYLFGVTARMLLGMVAVYLILYFIRQKLPLHRRAVSTYLVSGTGIYTAMTCVYWAAQHIPSGWISVVFGLSPIITGMLAIFVLREDSLSFHKLSGMILGFAGLIVIFGNSINSGDQFLYGITAVLLGTFFHSLSAVVVKRINAGLSGFASTAGGLSFAAPLFLVTWILSEGSLPAEISTRTLYAIIYLGVIASAIGFAMYYYILSRMDVSRVSLITLITPVCALGLGNILNGESVSHLVITGTGFILSGLLFYEYGHRLVSIPVGPNDKNADRGK